MEQQAKTCLAFTLCYKKIHRLKKSASKINTSLYALFLSSKLITKLVLQRKISASFTAHSPNYTTLLVKQEHDEMESSVPDSKHCYLMHETVQEFSSKLALNKNEVV
jgi:hypothetical protein